MLTLVLLINPPLHDTIQVKNLVMIALIITWFFVSSSVAVDCKEVVADCHEPLKGCIDCCKDPTSEICTTVCLTGPGPCFYKNDVDVAACVKDNHKKVTECAVNKDKSLVTANHCLSCHCP